MSFLSTQPNSRGVVLPKNKPLMRFFCDLDISISIGFVANLDETGQHNDAVWIDKNDTKSFQRHIGCLPLCHDGIQFQVMLDDTEIFAFDITGASKHNLHHRLAYDQELRSRSLCFTITGYDASHMILTSENIGARPGIMIESIKFENVDVRRCISKTDWAEFTTLPAHRMLTFTDNQTWTLNFHTPIYHWLLNHDKISVLQT